LTTMSGARDQLLELVSLNLIDQLGPLTMRDLLMAFGTPAKILSASRKDLMAIEGVGPKLSDSIVKASPADAEKELRIAEEAGARVLLQDEFPPGLKMIDGAPTVLYVRGELEQEDVVAVAVVGSRRCTLYGKSQAERLGYMLAQRGVTVVSGMARGVDSAAHAGALRASGRTIAVLGNGLSTVYPAENRKLFEEISRSGAVVSEFPMRTVPSPGNFPRRNRIISGLSLGVVVVEAAEASGSLITARWAVEQGREVFAVPGKAGSPTSKGTHSLIRDGAKLVEDVDDVIEELGSLKESLAGADGPGEGEEPDGAEGTEGAVLDVLSVDEPTDIEDVIHRCGLGPSEVSALLLKLELKGLVKALPGKAFVRSARL
jgi:DNA processing protein